MRTTPIEEGARATPEVRGFSVGITPKIQPYKISENHLEVGRLWQEWLEDFEEETANFEITYLGDKISALKIYGGLKVTRLALNLPDATPLVGDDDY